MQVHPIDRFAAFRFAYFLLAGAAMLAAGCSKHDVVDGPPGKAVAGIVRYQGQPVAEAIVTFMSPSYSAYGSTDGEGRFKLNSPGRGESVPFDHYQVTVVKSVPPAQRELTDAEQHTPPNPYAPLPPAAPPQDLLPAKYKAATSSGLAADVAASGPEEFAFDLTD
jgi:hypothetical protein